MEAINDYRLLGNIGGGASGAVYKAVRSGTHRPVAIKVFHERLADEELKRWWRELDALSGGIPVLPRMLDYGRSDDGRPFIVTEWIDGQRLDEALAPGGRDPSLRERAAILARVCDSVQVLHKNLLLHRDLKPENILIQSSGRVWLVDLGLAVPTIREDGPSVTIDGQVLGSPAYMSPEQARGEAGRLTTASDVYALGAIAHRILTGAGVHQLHGCSIQEAIAVVGRGPGVSAANLRDVPKPLARILLRACASEPSARYESAAALGDDLRRFSQGQRTKASRRSIVADVLMWASLHPRRATALVCIVLFLATLGLTGLSVWYLDRQPVRAAIRLDRSSVDLVTRLGRPIVTWEREPGVVRYARFIAEGSNVPGGAIVIGWDLTSEPQEAGRLCWYGRKSADVPRMMNGAGNMLLRQPRPSPDGDPDTFRLGPVIDADVFAAVPGREIIAAHNHTTGSATALRVYGADGRVLFQCWHDGRINDLLWLSGPSQIVAAAANCDAMWSELGDRDRHDDVWPAVVFAVRPVLGEAAGFIQTERGIGDFSVAWYRYLLPAKVLDDYRLIEPLTAAIPPHDATRRFRLMLQSKKNTLRHSTLIVSESGEIVEAIQDSGCEGIDARNMRLEPLLQGGPSAP